MEEKLKFKNLYNNPRLLYKYFPISKEYAIKYQVDDGFAFMFTPNISREELVKNKDNEISGCHNSCDHLVHTVTDSGNVAYDT